MVAKLAVSAGAVQWDGGGRTQQWLEPENWQFDRLPAATDTAIIVNDTALISGAIVPPVFAAEIGDGASPSGLQILGGVNRAALFVETDVAIARQATLSLVGGPTSARLSAANLRNQGEVDLGAGGEILLTGQFTQIAGQLSVENGGNFHANSLLVENGLVDALGTLDTNVTVGNGDAASATLRPGAGIGNLTITGDLHLHSDAVLEIQFGTTPRGGVIDTIAVGGTVTLGGTLDLSALGGAIPQPGAAYPILTAEKFVGRFDNILGTSIGSGSWIPTFDVLSGNAGVTYSQLRGNMNGDGVVDEADAALFAYAIRDSDSYFVDYYLNGFVANAFMADMDLDGFNTFADIPLFLEAVAQSGGNAASAFAAITLALNAVPEPSAGLLGSVMIALGMGNSRRRAPLSLGRLGRVS
jgi:hypothetical protein